MAHDTSAEPRWRRLPEERPRQILVAAFRTFAEQGLTNARLEDIAKAAGVSKATIYLYFSSKEELFREVVRETVGGAIERPPKTCCCSCNHTGDSSARRCSRVSTAG
jgi:AcrR family transcriptional regulator